MVVSRSDLAVDEKGRGERKSVYQSVKKLGYRSINKIKIYGTKENI